MSDLRVEKVDSVDALGALSADWRRLEEASDNRLPFRTFEWVESWWRHFAERRFLVEDRLAIRLVRDGQGTLVGAAPLMLTQRPAKGPLRVRFVQFFGADPNITELRGPLLVPGREKEAISALLSELREGSAAYDWIQWSGVGAGTALEEALTAGGQVQWKRDIPNFILPLAPSWEEFRAGLKRNIRESLRKCYNSLERDGHRFTLDVIEEPSQIRGAVERFFQLHAKRADVSGTITHRDVFDSPAARAFLVEVSERLAERRSTRIFALRIGGEVVALRIGYVLRDSMYLYYSGYDPAWGKYSVMTTVVAEAMRYAITQGLKTVNLSTGNDVSKTRWGPEEVLYREGLQMVPSARSRLAHRGYQRMLDLKADPRVRATLLRFLGRRRDA